MVRTDLLVPCEFVQEESLDLPKVERRLIMDGKYFEITCAVRSDGITSPASTFLDQLADGVWDDRDADVLPDERQPSLRRRFIASAEHLANYGFLENKAYNYLGRCMWELKAESARLSFYDTDGLGGWDDHEPEAEYQWDGRRRYKLPNELHEFIRLGFAFGKVAQKALPEDVQECMDVRQEDIAHDS